MFVLLAAGKYSLRADRKIRRSRMQSSDFFLVISFLKKKESGCWQRSRFEADPFSGVSSLTHCKAAMWGVRCWQRTTNRGAPSRSGASLSCLQHHSVLGA